ncbi:MAG TPA: zinc-binding dehydrogenase [Thermoleophilia bacterium]|nr:zinc-binding dehydrogenase [Thermoleophilia bacterium]
MLVHAVVITDRQLAWVERPDPSPGESELLVMVRAAGVNGADLAQREGVYPAPPGSPADVPGLELAGEVVAVGARVSSFALGDRVMGLVGGGGQATLAVVDEAHALPVPDGLSWPEAGGFVEATFTAFDALFNHCSLASGERLLITGAGGGVGTAAVQLGAVAGAEVTAAVRDRSLWAAIEELGAARVVSPDEAAAHGPYDVILELVGALSLASTFDALAVHGRVVVIGLSGGGSRLELDLHQLMGQRAQLRGSTLRVRSRAEKAALTATIGRRVLPLLAAGRVRVHVCATFPLAEADAAYERFARPGKLGKIVLVA